MNIAVVGAGIFGITVAHRISNLGNISLFEKNKDILSAASHANQLRLHRGYHYPRSPDTVEDLITSIDMFRNDYKAAIVDENDHYYAISKRDSLVTAEEYINFCDKFKLDYKIIENHDLINKDAVSLIVKVKESSIDYESLKKICNDYLSNSNINVSLGHKFSQEMFEKYDCVVNCTYSDINDLSNKDKDYQFEVCEKILVDLPIFAKNQSIVIMDGPFMCIDPYGRSRQHLLGNVVHAIHATNTGRKPVIPSGLNDYLNAGLIRRPRVTNFNKFVSSGEEFIPSLRESLYCGSLYTVRAVLPKLEKTDARPTIVSRESEKLINVFSGKIDTCSHAALKVAEMIQEMK